jgi:hypothetical protein
MNDAPFSVKAVLNDLEELGIIVLEVPEERESDQVGQLDQPRSF